MPIFVSRFSTARVAGANLQRVRARGNEQEAASSVTERRQSERARETTPGRAAQTRGRGELPVATQQADDVRTRLQVGADRTGSRIEAGRTATSEENTPTTSVAARRPASAGVGIERSRAERDIQRPGRLGQDTVNPAASRALSRFEGLRETARQQRTPATGNAQVDGADTRGRGNAAAQRQLDPAVAEAVDRFENLRTVAREGRPRGRAGAAEAAGRPAPEARGGGPGNRLEGLPTAQTPETPALDRETDARIRLVANAARGNSAFRDVDNAPAPTAEQISRANTTEEIRDNLRADTREVERGLLRDADTQNQANTRQTIQNAQQAAEQRRDSEVQSNTAETRELRTEGRRLERQLAATDREIRQRQSETARVRSGAGRNTAAAAGPLGSRVNILAA
jgi:hypothetical protein